MEKSKNWCVWTLWHGEDYPKEGRWFLQATFYPLAGYTAKEFALDYAKSMGGIALHAGQRPRKGKR